MNEEEDIDLRRQFEELIAAGENGENEANDEGTPEGQILWERSQERRRNDTNI